jgi:PHD/YefM family antitoxin component YafN of YafNO toxin-antitoxin module
MVEISSAEVGRHFSHYREKAELEPVVVLHYNKPSVVIVAASEFERLKRRDKKALSIEEMPEWLAELVINGKMDARHNHLDDILAPEGLEDSDPAAT